MATQRASKSNAKTGFGAGFARVLCSCCVIDPVRVNCKMTPANEVQAGSGTATRFFVCCHQRLKCPAINIPGEEKKTSMSNPQLQRLDSKM